MLAKIENLRAEVVVMRPVYNDTGDGCELITASGEVYQDLRNIKSVRRALARAYALDLRAQGEAVSKILNRRGILPFYLDSSRIYLPFKMRKPVAPNDYSYGYARLDRVESIEMVGNKSMLRLGNSLEIELTSSPASARQSLDLGRRLQGQLAPPLDEDEMMLQAVRVILAWLKK